MTIKYEVSRDTIRRRLQDLGLTWEYRKKILEGKLKEEFVEVEIDEYEFFKKKDSTQKPNASIVKASESESDQKESKSKRQTSVTLSKASESELDAIDMLLKTKASTSKNRIYRGFYFDNDVLNVIDGIASGSKSELVNEVLRKVFKEKGLL